MKAINKLRVAISSIAVLPLVIGAMIGVATPAVAPNRAEAQTLMLKKYENYAKFQPKELVTMLEAVGFQGQGLKYAWEIGRAHV